LLHPVIMVSSDRVATASTGIFALRFILVQISLWIARLRLILLRCLRGPILERKKLRAVIVIGFGLLASPVDKTRSAAAQEATADLLVQNAWID
jgi:hypothetical protein